MLRPRGDAVASTVDELVSTHRFQSNFAQGAGKEQADAAAAEDAMIRRYLEKQAQAIEDRHRSDLAKIADTNAKICVEIKILRCLRAESLRRPSRHRRDACSLAWRCRFLAARPSQDGQRREMTYAPDSLIDFHTGQDQGRKRLAART